MRCELWKHLRSLTSRFSAIDALPTTRHSDIRNRIRISAAELSDNQPSTHRSLLESYRGPGMQRSQIYIDKGVHDYIRRRETHSALILFLIHRYLGCSAGQSTDSRSTQAKPIPCSTITDGPVQITRDHPQTGHLQTYRLQTNHRQTAYHCGSYHFDPNCYSLREINCKNTKLYYQTDCQPRSLQERTNGI